MSKSHAPIKAAKFTSRNCPSPLNADLAAYTVSDGGQLSEFARTCVVQRLDPDLLETVGNIFLRAAAEIRGLVSMEAGHA